MAERDLQPEEDHPYVWGSEPAFPVATCDGFMAPGLTKREYGVLLLTAHVMSTSMTWDWDPQSVADVAAEQVDACFQRLNQGAVPPLPQDADGEG